MQAELVFGFVYGVGTNADPVVSLLKDYLNQYSYTSHEFRVSEHLKALNLGVEFNPFSSYERMAALMTAGDKARRLARANDILAVMAVNEIAGRRTEERPLDGVAHIIRSFKTPAEVQLLRDVYRPGFFLIGIASDDDEQRSYLGRVKGLSEEEVENVILRDQSEGSEYGQRTRDTFYLADVFVELSGERYKTQLDRFLELVFAHPFKTPTREEHAMFMAYGSGARSAQFGRQVGAAIATAEVTCWRSVSMRFLLLEEGLTGMMMQTTTATIPTGAGSTRISCIDLGSLKAFCETWMEWCLLKKTLEDFSRDLVSASTMDWR